jgi:hypothetical protein
MEMQDFRFFRNFLAWHPSQATERQLPTAMAPYESSRRFLSFSKVEEGHLVYTTGFKHENPLLTKNTLYKLVTRSGYDNPFFLDA